MLIGLLAIGGNIGCANDEASSVGDTATEVVETAPAVDESASTDDVEPEAPEAEAGTAVPSCQGDGRTQGVGEDRQRCEGGEWVAFPQQDSAPPPTVQNSGESGSALGTRCFTDGAKQIERELDRALVCVDDVWTEEEEVVAAAPKEPIVFSGSGQQVVTIDDGSAAMIEPGIVEAVHDGSSNFQVTLLDRNGDRLDGLINEIGPYSGRRPWALADNDQPKFVEVNADGTWSLTVFDLVDVDNLAFVDYAPGASYAGLGDDIFYLLGADGPVIMDFACSDCDSNIQVRAYSDRGQGLINEIGDGVPFQASVVVPAGTFIIEVETSGRSAPGEWIATFE